MYSDFNAFVMSKIVNEKPSPLPSLYEFQAFVSDGATWEALVTFAFSGVSRFKNSCLVRRVSINDAVFPVICSSSWDLENDEFYYELSFELWLYNVSSQSFEFHDRFVGIWLNMTT